jgi:nitrous oxidase accessory protein NosD
MMTAPAMARTILVNPGPGTPLQDAIDAAAPRDTIRLADGSYNEAVVIDKALRLRGPRQLGLVAAHIDAGCGATAALTIAADDVSVRNVNITRGTFYTVDIQNRDRVRLKDVFVSEVGGLGCGAVEYGINVYASTDVRIERCFVNGDVNGYTGVAGYHDAGIYIGAIPAGANVQVKTSLVVGSNRGIILEDSAHIRDGHLTVLVKKNSFSSNDTGIFVHNSDGMHIERNGTNDSRGSTPAVSIELDATSDENVIKGNSFTDAAVDVINDGISNCWFANTVETGTVPTGGCP